MPKKTTPKYDKKSIRALIIRQIKEQVPSFSRLDRESKREVVTKIVRIVERELKDGNHSFPVMTDLERLNLQHIPDKVLSLHEMQALLEKHQRVVLPLPSTNKTYITDPLLKAMDRMLDDSFLNTHILKPDTADYGKREWMPAQLLRIELLRSALFPEVSARKFCTLLSSRDRKQERAFCGLPLNRTITCDHSVLSRFRTGLNATQRINLLVYMLHHFLSSGIVSAHGIHAIDATDIQTPVDTKPLVKLELPNGEVIRIYSDLDCDSGPRRSKRNKSTMYVGYKLHTLCICDVSKGIAFPLISLMSAANHHDSQLLLPMMALAQTIGLDVKFVAADEAYADVPKQTALLNEGIAVVTPPESKAKPKLDNVDGAGHVFCHGHCECPMAWDGYDTEEQHHRFVCSGCESCPFGDACPKERLIPLDTKHFGPVPKCSAFFDDIIGQRKHAERPFNLIKHMDGLEPCRMRTMDSIATQATLSHMVGLFKVMAELRAQPKKEKPKKPQQQEFHFEATGT